jgi:hypothetical protein
MSKIRGRIERAQAFQKWKEEYRILGPYPEPSDPEYDEKRQRRFERRFLTLTGVKLPDWDDPIYQKR